MKIEDAITILKTHNEWRRGADIPMTDPKILGEAIDTVIEHYDDAFIPVAESYERGFMEGKEVGEREPSDEMIMRILNCIGYEEESWIGFVRRELKKRKEPPTYDAEYLQSKIDAHTQRVEEHGLTSDKMLEECRGGDLLTWHKVADGDLPKDGQLVLISNPAIQFAIFKKVFSPVVRFGRKFEIDDTRTFVGVDYWMEIPEIKVD